MAKCPNCDFAVPLHSKKCGNCPAEFSSEGWLPVSQSAEETAELNKLYPQLHLADTTPPVGLRRFTAAAIGAVGLGYAGMLIVFYAENRKDILTIGTLLIFVLTPYVMIAYGVLKARGNPMLVIAWILVGFHGLFALSGSNIGYIPTWFITWPVGIAFFFQARINTQTAATKIAGKI